MQGKYNERAKKRLDKKLIRVKLATISAGAFFCTKGGCLYGVIIVSVCVSFFLIPGGNTIIPTIIKLVTVETKLVTVGTMLVTVGINIIPAGKSL